VEKMSGEIIKAEGLTKVFNKHLVAVDHVSFGVKGEESFGFLGPNGAGKTTTSARARYFIANCRLRLPRRLRTGLLSHRHSAFMEIPHKVAAHEGTTERI